MSLSLNIKKLIKDFIFFFIERLNFFSHGNKPLDRKTLIKNILIFEGGGMGDLIRIFPAIDALIDNFPKASFSIVVAKNSRETLDLYPKKESFSEIFEYDLKGTHAGVLKKLRLVFKLRKYCYDMLYIPTRGEGMRELNIMALLTGIPIRIGFTNKGVGTFNTIKSEFREDVPILKQNLSLLKTSGLIVRNEKIEIKVPEKDMAFADAVLSKRNAYPITVVHRGASWYGEYRIWKIENMIMLMGELLKKFGGTIILIGSKNEKEIGSQIDREMNHPSMIDLIGKTSVSQAAAIIKKSHLFIGNDSGPLHIALALGIPSVAIFGPTSPQQVIGEEYQNNCLFVRKEMPCSPCYLHQKNDIPSCTNINCIETISLEDVMKAVNDQMAGIREKIS